MRIREYMKYEHELTEEDLEAIYRCINMMYQFKNNKEAWEPIQKEIPDGISIENIITALETIGGEQYKLYSKKIK